MKNDDDSRTAILKRRGNITYHSKVNMRESVYDRLDKKDVENVQKGQ